MCEWKQYSRQEVRKDLVNAKALAVKFMSGATKTVTERGSMLHYAKYDCSTLIDKYKIL